MSMPQLECVTTWQDMHERQLQNFNNSYKEGKKNYEI